MDTTREAQKRGTVGVRAIEARNGIATSRGHRHEP
jgi:hypothetical protein